MSAQSNKLASEAFPTESGNRGLMIEEPLIFETGKGNWDESALDDLDGSRLGDLGRREAIGLPRLSEPETVRHYTRLSRQNYAIDLGLFPLGSCTMKHNPRLNEHVARLPGFADIHPLAPVSTVQGALEVVHELGEWLKALTGMAEVAMSPKAGAQGELCGMMAIRAALDARGESRSTVLVPDSAHGTNPASAAQAGFKVETIPSGKDGRLNLQAVQDRLNDDVAAVMITNPNTAGCFEKDFRRIADAVHAAGGFVYCDGANFNAIVGRVRPGDLGVDAMHINLHKTFSTPHGGGGPGSGPVVFSGALAPYAPLPIVRKIGDTFVLLEEEDAAEHCPDNCGRFAAFHGQMGMFTRALAYMLSHGADGLRQVSGDAVLNANYILRSLEDVLDAPFAAAGPCMHEALFSDKTLPKGTSTLDIAKAMIDEGFHPMTVYFPLIVQGAMLIEPTETESRESLDTFIRSLRKVAERARAGDEALKQAPVHAPRRRLDETQAARKPHLVWDGALAEG